MNEWTNEQKNERTNEQANERTHEWMNTRMKETNEQMNLQAILKWNNCKNIVTVENKLTLVYTILGSFLPDTEQRLLFCSLHFEANDFPLAGLRVWAVTSAVTARFSLENIFGFDIPSEACKPKCEQETLLNSKSIACLIHEKYRKRVVNIIELRWLVRCGFRKWPYTDKTKNFNWLFTDPIFARLFTVVLRIQQRILPRIFNDNRPVGVRLLFM